MRGEVHDVAVGGERLDLRPDELLLKDELGPWYGLADGTRLSESSRESLEGRR